MLLLLWLLAVKKRKKLLLLRPHLLPLKHLPHPLLLTLLHQLLPPLPLTLPHQPLLLQNPKFSGTKKPPFWVVFFRLYKTGEGVRIQVNGFLAATL